MILVAHNFCQASAVLNGTQLFLGAAEPNNITMSELLSFEKYTGKHWCWLRTKGYRILWGSVKCRLQTDERLLFLGLENNGTICHVLICMVKTVVRCLHFTLTSILMLSVH